MSHMFKDFIKNIHALSPVERALAAHCLISSLETKQDDGVDEAWAGLSETRLIELTSGRIKGSSWNDIKSEVTG